ncbi:MAG: TatD family hydrolase, partial [Patescibacteria group bacterium]
MLDIHTHLYWDSYDVDRDEVIARARVAGVKQLLVVGTTIEESRKAIALAEQYDDVYASVGIHPNEFRSEVGEYIDELQELARHPKVVAIGECGLDYSESHGAITEEQKE